MAFILIVTMPDGELLPVCKDVTSDLPLLATWPTREAAAAARDDVPMARAYGADVVDLDAG